MYSLHRLCSDLLNETAVDVFTVRESWTSDRSLQFQSLIIRWHKGKTNGQHGLTLSLVSNSAHVLPFNLYGSEKSASKASDNSGL